jgi:pimeloyl-ACP methyl ester carboxylesterase
LWRMAYQFPIAAPMPNAAKVVALRLLGAVIGGRPPDEVDAYLEPLSQPAQVRATTLLYRQFLTREVGPLLARRYAGARVSVPVHYMMGSDDLLFYEGVVDEPAPHADAEYRGEVLRGVGHFVPDEAPDLLRDRVLDLFRRRVAV